MAQDINLLFVYGSLLSGFKNPAYAYLAEYFKLKGPAHTRGKLYHNGNYPVAVPSPEEQFIKGELWELKNAHEYTWAFEQLDDYEGVKVMPGESPLYVRAETEVLHEGNSFLSWVYWFNGSVQGMDSIPSGDVFDFFSRK